MIFQEPMASFSPVHTIGSQILENLVIHTRRFRKGADRTIEMLQRVGIAGAPVGGRLSAPVQRRRAPTGMIAMALICGKHVDRRRADDRPGCDYRGAGLTSSTTRLKPTWR